MLQPLDRRTKALLDLADFVEKSDHYDHSLSCSCLMGHYAEKEGDLLDCLFVDQFLNYMKLIIAEPFTWDHDKKEELNPNDHWSPNAAQAASCLRHYALTGVVDWQRVRDQEMLTS